MPYNIFKKEDKFCVYKINDDDEPVGDSLGCHEEKDDAKKQMAALYANEEKKSIKAEHGMHDAEDVSDYDIFEVDGKYCVHELTEDGKMGKKIACHESKEDAKEQLAAILVAETRDEKSFENASGDGVNDSSDTLDPEELDESEKSAPSVNLEQQQENEDKRSVSDESLTPLDFLDRQFEQLDEEGAVYVKSIFDGIKAENLDDVYKKFHSLVNMSASELESWAKTECSGKASLSRAPIKRVLTLLRKKKSEWGAADIKQANRVISFISRMSKMEQGDPVSKDCEYSKRDISLRNWGRKAMDVEKLNGHPVKALYEGEDQIRIGAYGVIWGDEEKRDLHGEFFTKDTQDMMAVFRAMGAIPFIFHHGGKDEIKSFVAGKVDYMVADETGLYYEAIIKEQELYMQYIKPLIDGRRLYSSSGTLPAAKRVTKSGHITRWPIVEMTGTHIPAEWRMIDHPIVKKHFEEIGLDIEQLDSDLVNEDSQGFEKERELKLNNELIKSRLQLQILGDLT